MEITIKDKEKIMKELLKVSEKTYKEFISEIEKIYKKDQIFNIKIEVNISYYPELLEKLENEK